jgi:hypothetical protein
MNKLLLLFCTLVFPFGLSAQESFSILFVNDGFIPSNAEIFTDAIEAAGYTYDFFDAANLEESPTADIMENYDLVVWHTSNDGVGLWLWNGDDTDNEDLMEYLSSGGSLWLVGLDFLFDRYGVPPADFESGSFVYDYLGIDSYDVQTYGDDNESGVPFIFPDAQSPISGLNSLTWIFPVLWWVDGVTLTDAAQPVYRMGDEDYVFFEEVCGAWFDDGNHRVLSYFFDVSVIEAEELLNENVETVLAHFESFALNSDEVLAEESFRIFPNPTSSFFRIEWSGTDRIRSIRLLDLSGRMVQQYEEEIEVRQSQNLNLNAGDHLAEGVYLLEISASRASFVRKLMISK